MSGYREVKATSKEYSSSLSALPPSKASCSPLVLSGQSYLHRTTHHTPHVRTGDRAQLPALCASYVWTHHPVNLFSSFQVLSPCLTSTSVYLVPAGTSLAFISGEERLERAAGSSARPRPGSASSSSSLHMLDLPTGWGLAG